MISNIIFLNFFNNTLSGTGGGNSNNTNNLGNVDSNNPLLKP